MWNQQNTVILPWKSRAISKFFMNKMKWIRVKSHDSDFHEANPRVTLYIYIERECTSKIKNILV